MTNGRQKGSVAEREVAELFEKWWRVLEPDCRFVRTPLSGGWHSPQVRQGFKMSGDLMTTALRFPWTIEVKRREGWNLDRLLSGRPSPVWGWWKQAQTQGCEQGAEPLLLLRRSHEDWRMMLRWEYAREMFSPTMMGVHYWKGIWPRSRGQRAVLFLDAGFLFTTPPERFALPAHEPVTSVRRRRV